MIGAEGKGPPRLIPCLKSLLLIGYFFGNSGISTPLLITRVCKSGKVIFVFEYFFISDFPTGEDGRAALLIHRKLYLVVR